MTKITYNGKTTELADGYIATWPCKDLKMETDVVVEAPEPAEISDSPLPIEISTEAEMTALLESGEVGGVYKYTGTTGTYENGALYVLENATITFTIDGTSYQAESGMTWSQWVASDYNTDGYKAHDNYGTGTEDGKVPQKNNYCITYNSTVVHFGDLIIANTAYGLTYNSGTGGSN